MGKCSFCNKHVFFPSSHICKQFTLATIDDDFTPAGDTVEEQWQSIIDIYGEYTFYAEDIEEAAEEFSSQNCFSDGYGYEEGEDHLAFLVKDESGEEKIRYFTVKQTWEPVYTAEENLAKGEKA